MTKKPLTLRTMTKGIETSEGFIAHKPLAWEGGTLHAPVKLSCRGSTVAMIDGNPVPMRMAGRLVFALPGGAEHVA